MLHQYICCPKSIFLTQIYTQTSNPNIQLLTGHLHLIVHGQFWLNMCETEPKASPCPGQKAENSWVFTLPPSNFYLWVWLILLPHISLFSVPPGALVTKLSHSCLEHSDDGVPLVLLHPLLRLMIHHTPPTTWLGCSSWHTVYSCRSPV